VTLINLKKIPRTTLFRMAEQGREAMRLLSCVVRARGGQLRIQKDEALNLEPGERLEVLVEELTGDTLLVLHSPSRDARAAAETTVGRFEEFQKRVASNLEKPNAKETRRPDDVAGITEKA
jgi:hypothetical protein